MSMCSTKSWLSTRFETGYHSLCSYYLRNYISWRLFIQTATGEAVNSSHPQTALDTIPSHRESIVRCLRDSPIDLALRSDKPSFVNYKIYWGSLGLILQFRYSGKDDMEILRRNSPDNSIKKHLCSWVLHQRFTEQLWTCWSWHVWHQHNYITR